MGGLSRGAIRAWSRRFGGGRSRSRAPGGGDPRVGIITAYEAQKGIRTIARDIHWAIEGRATVFPMTRLDLLDEQFPAIRASAVSAHLQREEVAAADTPIRGWLESQDIVIFIERIHPKIVAHCRARGIRTVLVALVDWLPEATAMRRRGLVAYDRVVSFSHQADELLAAEGCERVAHITPASTWPPAQAERGPVADTLYFPVGVGGPENRRNVALVLDVFSRLRARHPDIRLIIKIVPEAYGFHPELRGLAEPGVNVVDDELSDEGMRQLQVDTDICLFPSRYEGLGYPMLESLQCGVPVVATDAPPMNELVRDGRNGLLVRAKPVGAFGLQTVWELDGDDLEAKLERLLGPSGAALWCRLRQNIPGEREVRTAACRTGWRRLVTGLAPRALNVGCGETTTPGAVNVDIRALPGVQVCAAAGRLPFGDDAFDEVFAHDVVEHVPRAEVAGLVGEWARVLRRGGMLEIRTPDLRAVARRLIAGRDSVTETARWLYGDQDHPHNFHEAILDEVTLRELLARHGIIDIKRRRRHIHPNNMQLKGWKAG